MGQGGASSRHLPCGLRGQQPAHVLRYHLFFVGCECFNNDTARSRRDDACTSCVALGIQGDAQLAEIRANVGANHGGIGADSAGKYEAIEAAQDGGQCCQV